MIRIYSDAGPSMTSKSDIDAIKNYMSYNKLKLYPTPMVGIGKGHYSRVLSGCEIFF